MEIDLGNEEKANIVFCGQSYQVRLPSVLDAEKFQHEIKEKKGKEIEVFRSFVVSLGLPDDVVNKLQMAQMTKLSNGLLGVDEKK